MMLSLTQKASTWCGGSQNFIPQQNLLFRTATNCTNECCGYDTPNEEVIFYYKKWLEQNDGRNYYDSCMEIQQKVVNKRNIIPLLSGEEKSKEEKEEEEEEEEEEQWKELNNKSYNKYISNNKGNNNYKINHNHNKDEVESDQECITDDNGEAKSALIGLRTQSVSSNKCVKKTCLSQMIKSIHARKKFRSKQAIFLTQKSTTLLNHALQIQSKKKIKETKKKYKFWTIKQIENKISDKLYMKSLRKVGFNKIKILFYQQYLMPNNLVCHGIIEYFNYKKWTIKTIQIYQKLWPNLPWKAEFKKQIKSLMLDAGVLSIRAIESPLPLGIDYTIELLYGYNGECGQHLINRLGDQALEENWSFLKLYCCIRVDWN